MKIGIDCLTMLNIKKGEYAGIAHYSYFIVKALIENDKENEYILFFYDRELDVSEFEADNVTIVQMPLVRYKKFLPFIYRHILTPLFFYSKKINVMHFLAPIKPLLYRGVSVVTVHDLAIYKNPNWFGRLSSFFTKVIVPRSIISATKIIAVSQATKDDIVDKFPKTRNKIHIVHEGVEDDRNYEINQYAIRDVVKIKKPYFLFVGTIEPRKNIVRLMEAFRLFKEKYPDSDMQLVLAGKFGWKYDDVQLQLDDPKNAQDVHYVGYVQHDEKVYLYRNAFALTYPSYFEGFGLPLLEAMNLGVPVITSNEGAISEVVIDNAVLVDPYSEASIASAMGRLYRDEVLRERLIETGIGIASAFTWSDAAKNTVDAYKEAIQK